jgi:poly(ADP-ribose) glycohydrolase
LIANAFLCTFPKQGVKFQDFSFKNLFCAQSQYDACPPHHAAKLRCIVHYFSELPYDLNQPRSIEIERKAMLVLPDWSASTTKLCSNLVCDESTLIEDSSPSNIHVDFANRMIGGGVLGHVSFCAFALRLSFCQGCIQEEILFVVKPECLVSLLFVGQLRGNEVAFIRGAKRFSAYTGYSKTFRFVGNYNGNE